MAKKRRIKKRKKTLLAKTRIAAKKLPQHQKLKGALAIADTLVLISIFFLLINALLVFIFPTKPVEALAALGIQTTVVNWIALGVAWVFLAGLAYVSNRMVKTFRDRHQMWGLLIISILTAVTLRFESAALIFIAAVIYLAKLGKK